jgi:hypothetical protein
LNRSTILRAIKGGKISGTRDELGAWHVEPVELHRVFPAVAAEAALRAVPQHARADAKVHVRLAVAEERLSELRQALADMRAQRDSWQTQAERLALTAQAERQGAAQARSSVPTVTVVARKSWWRWRRAG